MSGEHGGPNQGGTMVDSGPKPDSNEAPLHGDRGIRIELDPEEHARRLEDWKANQRLMEAAAKPVTDSAPSGGDMGTTAEADRAHRAREAVEKAALAPQDPEDVSKIPSPAAVLDRLNPSESPADRPSYMTDSKWEGDENQSNGAAASAGANEVPQPTPPRMTDVDTDSHPAHLTPEQWADRGTGLQPDTVTEQQWPRMNVGRIQTGSAAGAQEGATNLAEPAPKKRLLDRVGNRVRRVLGMNEKNRA